MSQPALLLCSEAGLALDALPSSRIAVVGDLCNRPEEAAAALREIAASRVVLGLCCERPTRDLVAALRRAGAEPFAIEGVSLQGRTKEEAVRLLSAASAKLATLAPGEEGKPAPASKEMSRRTLLTFAVARARTEVAVVDEAACVGVPGCGLCIQACPARAIRGSSGPPTIDTSACTACGACVPRCPQGALRLAGSATAQTEAQLEELLPGMTGILFACRNAKAEARTGWALVELPTLSLVSPGWLLQARARGAEVELAPCGNECCAGVEEVETFAQRILDALGPPRSISDARIELSEPAATATGVLRLTAPTSSVVVEDPASPLGLLALDPERCTLCGACARTCPTSALDLYEGPDATVLRHRPAACVACGRCVTSCPETALDVERGIDVARLGAGSIELAREEREVCARCGADLPPRSMRRRLRELLPEFSGTPIELCAGCAVRTAHPQDGAPAKSRGLEYDRAGGR